MKTIRIAQYRDEYDDSYMDYGPSSPMDMTMHFYDNNLDDEVPVEVEVEFSVEPREMEGPYVFYPGGIEIEKVILSEPLTIEGMRFTAGTSAFDVAERLKQDTSWIEEEALAEIKGQGLKVPVKKYPISR